MLACIVSIQRSNASLCCAAFSFLHIFFFIYRVNKKWVADPNPIVSPNFAKIKGIFSVLCAAFPIAEV